MAIGFDQTGVSFDSSNYTFDGTFVGVVGGALFLSVSLTAQNVAATTSANVAAVTAANVWST